MQTGGDRRAPRLQCRCQFVKYVAMRAFAVVLCAASCGCASIISSVTEGLAEDMSSALLNTEDLQVAREGSAAFLIMLEGFLRSSPDSTALMQAGVTLNGAYATAFVDDPERRRLFAERAFELAQRASCAKLSWACSARTDDIEVLRANLNTLDQDDVPLAYALASSWAGWISANSGDWGAVAELGRAKAIMTRIAEVDETHDNAGPRLYLGVMESLLPPALGGRPEVGRAHFERAIELARGQYLMPRVLFAEHYARLMFDRELHDRELSAVLQANPRVEGLTLSNRIAQKLARELLESADEYF